MGKKELVRSEEPKALAEERASAKGEFYKKGALNYAAGKEGDNQRPLADDSEKRSLGPRG